MEYTYQPCEEYVIINDDPDLTPNGEGIKIQVLDLIQKTYKQYGKPIPNSFPDIKKIDGYGLPPDQQVFNRIHIPQKLITLERSIRNKERSNKAREQTSIKIEINVINKVWETLEDHYDDYKEEVEWIEKMWFFRLFGYWVFLNGRPYYMTGANYFFLNFTEIPKAGFPQYRDRDRRWYIATKWAETETTTFAKTDKEGVAIPNSDGTYDMIDLQRRVFYGIISAKPRRVGDTSKSASIEVEEATRTYEGHFANQGADEESSQRIFNDHIMFQFRKLSIIWKPLMESVNSKSKLSFVSDDPDLSLGVHIDFASSKRASHYDGKTAKRYYGDEIAKMVEEDIVKRHSTIKLITSERDRIDGSITYTSTVELMDKESGLNYLKLCKASKFHQRKDNGQTLTGMIVIFFRASDGYPGFVDQYGFSIERNPLPYQREFLKLNSMNPNHGAFDYLMGNRKGLSDDALSQEKRQNCLCYREIFTPPANNNFFPIDLIEKRVTELRFGEQKTRSFNISWVDGFGGKVGIIFPPEGQDGNYLSSMIPPPNEQNRYKILNGIQYPEFANKYICSADAFRLDKTNSARMSDGGVALRLKRDFQIDPDTKPVKDWLTGTQIVYASYRPPTTDEFCEDVLKLCIFYGCLCYPESDVDHISKYFKAHGFEGYLMYDTDEWGNPKENAGYSSTHVKVKGFNLMRDDLNMHVHRATLEPLLTEALNILGLADLTNFDGLSSYMGCLLGEKSLYAEDLAGRFDPKYDVSNFFRMRSY